jgi:iron complex outermembrane receptor protein
MRSTVKYEARHGSTPGGTVAAVVRSALASVCATPFMMGSVYAQSAASTTDALVQEEITVTGSRIRREGFEAPTPVAVIGIESLEATATSNVADTLNTMPNFQNSATPQSSAVTVTSGTQAVNGLNIGGLGVTRTLVLVNGRRTVGSTLEGTVDVSELPQQLITRVDVVTGGASASYGSDALTGVVNFVLDTEFTGLKAEASAGTTNYGDNDNWKASLTYGTAFAGGRGHLIISGEASDDKGLLVNDRPWNRRGYGFVNNPAYTSTNGQPRLLFGDQFSLATAAFGGIVNNTLGQVAGLPAGTTVMFGQNGQLVPITYGPLLSGAMMSGGDWEQLFVANKPGSAALMPEQSRENLYLRASYELDGGSEVFFEASYGHLDSYSASVPVFYKMSWNVPGDNAFIPADLVAAAGCDTASSAPCFNFGTLNGDIGGQHPITERSVLRFLTGIEGGFNMFQTDWTWDAYLSYGRSWQHVISGNTINQVKYDMAIDAVRDGNGAIVCRSTLTDPDNGCEPLNLFGLGVASPAALAYVTGNPWSAAELRQTVGAINVQGTPWQGWAGPISLAFGIEHRRQETDASSNDLERAAPGVCAPGSTRDTGSCWFLAAGLPYSGSYEVSDAYLETNVPLAKDLPLVRALDVSLAGRGTHYSTSGTTGTWKVGVNWTPVDDLRFRFVRSLDIREPTLIDLYQAGTTTSNTITDKRVNSTNITFQATRTGNPNLEAERADNTIFGFVYQPSWLPRFNFSADYYIIDIDGGVNTLSEQQTYDSCFMAGIQDACDAISVTRYIDVVGTDGNTYSVPEQITGMRLVPRNSNGRKAERLELATSYRLTADTIIPGLPGNLALRGSATHYIKDIEDGGIPYVLPNDRIGNNYSGGLPHWKYQLQTMYVLDRFSTTLTMRGVSSGVYSNLWIECQTDCPAFPGGPVGSQASVDAANYVTTNRNHIAGAIWWDLAVNYTLDFGKSDTELFFNVRNLFDKDPPIAARQQAGSGWNFGPANAGLYDVLGRFYRAGFRVKF